MHSWFVAALWVLLSFAPALSGLGAAPGDWYASLEKPPWTPPNWLFGPVWTTLYLLMGVAAWLVWRNAGWSDGGAALGLFCAQLVVNAAWTPIFFRWHEMGWALACIVLLWVLVAATILAFRRHSATAAGLLVPYVLWLTLATALNLQLWRLNG
ncbi:MAG: TspO/MBR family protein [Planctomycetota bacterium]|jgi:tryptophan-rich sensory protein